VKHTYDFTKDADVMRDVTIDRSERPTMRKAGADRRSGHSPFGGIGVGLRRATALVGMGLVVSACGTAEADAGAEEDTSFRRVINVRVITLAAADFDERIRLAGTVAANRDVVVSAEEAGVVREILAEEGASVVEGQPLLRIDDTILASQVAEAEARASLARETWDRRRRLFEDDGVGSELAYLEARYQSEQAEAVLATLRERLARAVVRAPIPGIFDSRDVEVGTMMSPGTRVGRIVQIDPVKVRGGVPERYAGDIRRGSAATVTFDVLPDEVYSGEIGYVGATVNPSSRTFEVEFVLANPGQIVKPEMVANIDINRQTIPDAITVPQEALVRVEDGFVAFVVEEENGEPVARARPVTVGPTQRNQAVVREGLVAGDRLIVVGQAQVANGDRVQIIDGGAAAGAER
jgi:membrane fusion protein, multidrug efflux system